MSTNPTQPPFADDEQPDYVDCAHCKNPFPFAEGNGSIEFPLCSVCNDD